MVDTPFLRTEESGEIFPLREVVTTVGRGRGVDIRLDDPSVSRLHAELVRRGPYVYVVDLGLSRNGTRVNGRPIARRHKPRRPRLMLHIDPLDPLELL